MLWNYPPLRYSEESHTITILLLLPYTFAAFPWFTPKAITTAPIKEAPMDAFYTWPFGPDEMIDLFPIFFGRMEVDFFFCKLLLDPTCCRGAANKNYESW